MLRLPPFQTFQPSSIPEALALLAEYKEDALLVAGGTDLVPNMKHELFTPKVLVALQGIDELHGIQVTETELVIGAMTSLEDVAKHAELMKHVPVLTQAAGLVAGPQLRSMGTLGGNVMLDTRCQWYNQTYFWRSALGFCMKKDGSVCHVVEGGKKCVAAASNDTAPALMTLDATLVFEGQDGRHSLPVADLWLADGIYNKRSRGEILVEVRCPKPRGIRRSAYGKLRERGSIDFPLLGIAVRIDLDAKGAITDVDLCAVALQAKPTRLRKIAQHLVGLDPTGSDFDDALERVAQLAAKQLRPLANIPGDEQWRHAMVPVYTRRTLLAAVQENGPVHHI